MYREMEVMIYEKDAESLRIIEGYPSYSQAHQDLFVRVMLGFKTGGSYVEIGAAEPKQSNNTFILERDFSWSVFHSILTRIWLKIFEQFV